MNEVNTAQPASPRANRASSQGSANLRFIPTQPGKTGNSLPLAPQLPQTNAQTNTSVAAAPLVDTPENARQKVEAAIASINEYMQSVQRELRISVDEELNRTIVRVIDSDSGELVRQIPHEVVLDLARKLKVDGEFQLLDALG